MEYLLNDGWLLADLAPDTTREATLAAARMPVDLPHDALICNTAQLYRDCDLCYFRTLTVTEAMLEQVVRLSFDGVYMDCDVWADDRLLCTHHYGYTSFQVVLTPVLHLGEVALAVCVRHRHPNSRWYTRAGIYRDVKLQVFPRRYLEPDGVYAVTREITPELWQVEITAEIAWESEGEQVLHRLLDAFGQVVAQERTPDGKCCLTVCSPALRDVSRPVLYTLESSLPDQVVTHRIGFRTVTFAPDRGMLLNHQPVKLHGVCLHHDLGTLGAAFHRKAEERRLRIMQRMGVNALRTSHNPPAPQTLALCDELGILVVDEAFDPYSFISAGMYSGKRGEVTAGNEQGVAFARDGESEVWFDQVDFGPAWSDRVTLPIFAPDDKLHEIFMYAGEQLIAVLPYQKPCSWNEYQPETYTLPMALTGIQTIRFRLHEKLHLKGFQFERQSRAWRYLTASQADSMYGDSFTRSDTAILDIGNNVTLTFDGLDFGTQKQVWLHLDGATPLTATPITLTLTDAQGCALTRQLMFDKQSRGSCAYPLTIPGGVLSASFVFLPGCRFDFYGLRFSNSANSAALFPDLMK